MSVDITYLHVFLNTIEAEEIWTVIIPASNQIIDALRSPALMALIKSKVAWLLPILSQRTRAQLLGI
jgi:hypothetical protein